MFLKRCGRNSQSLNAIKRRSSRPEVVCKKGVLRNFAKFTCARVSLLIKLQASDLQPYWKRDSGTDVFLWQAFFLWILTLVAASESNRYSLFNWKSFMKLSVLLAVGNRATVISHKQINVHHFYISFFEAIFILLRQ